MSDELEDRNPMSEEPEVEPEPELEHEEVPDDEEDGEEDSEDDLGDFVDGGMEAVAFDPTKVITLRTTNGDARHVETDHPITVREVISKAGVFVGGNVEYWLNGAKVSEDALVPAGQTLGVYGSVKGG